MYNVKIRPLCPQGAGGVGGLLFLFINGVPYIPCYDANGNIVAYVNESGAVVARYAYDAFGNLISQSGSMADTFRFRFSTKYHDPGAGNYYYGYRFYSPELGRWLNRDPIEEDGGINLYGFVGNNPVNNIDNLGLSVSPVVLEEILSVIGSALFGSRILDEAAFWFYGGRENLINATGRQLYSRGILAGKMWDRAVSGKYPNGTTHGDLLRIDESNQSSWGGAIDIIQRATAYKDKVKFIQKRLKEGTSPSGYMNIEFNTPPALASSIHGAQLHYKCHNCELILTIRDEYNFDKKHMWRRLQQEGYITPYSVIILMPTEKCGRRK